MWEFAHTTLVPVGYLYGINRVRESIEDGVVGKFLKDAIFTEICPTLDLSQEELDQFSNDVLDRFRNPYLIAFYKRERGLETIVIKDDAQVLEFFKKHWESNDTALIVKAVLSHAEFWGTDLTSFEGLEQEVAKHLKAIVAKGMQTALK